MRWANFLIGLFVAVAPAFAVPPTYRIIGTDPGAWAKIFASIGLTQAGEADAGVIVLGSNAGVDAARLAENHIVILQGANRLTRSLGLVDKEDTVQVRRICDVHAPKMQIIWEEPVSVPAVDLPPTFQVFATEKWKGIPVIAGKRTAHGAILWLSTPPGPTGIERYPYLLQALIDLDLSVPARTTMLWAFFDSSYRIRADVDYLARRWRESGIAVLHVAAWHNVEPDPIQDEFLKRLIEACHRNAILVYAWLELPHVSEKFWADHPEWREKTAVGQDAQLDWRKLMNLQNPDCRREVAKQISGLLQRFDWDGVNVAELYFESLEGASNPARFTPMNDDVRREFKQMAAFDPKLLFDPASPYSASKNPAALRKFLDFRAGLASRMQADWLDVLDRTRSSKPYLDIVLTHIDDRFEPGIRDALGADVARSLPFIQARHSTLLVEDPATLWNLGPERYSKLAQKYRELTADHSQFAVDINVVERYQDVYPTKKQTGVELFELVHEAAASFHRVALYFENSLEKQDLALLPVSATTARVSEKSADELQIDAAEPTRVDWRGPVEIDGKPWPLQSRKYVLAPAGKHRLSVGTAQPVVTISDFNGEIQSALESKDWVDLSYSSRSRAIALLGSPVSSIEVDGAPFWKRTAGENTASIMLPAGQHIVTFDR
ncbi:MAG: hypothetical protein JOY62_02550 [Acidobacteriaceae bacterium]|nr:hypothetical protein [Acidobacteriaceae bacterium]MBV9778830.1 hypothetical protein [Acidobacteriaceae bacterium]